MSAAIYARKSTEQNGVADEQRSITRQVEHAKQYAKRKGWTVGESCIFVDDGISGAEFAARPGFVRLMNALKPKPAFEVLIMSEESRLGREAIETAYALKQPGAGRRARVVLPGRPGTDPRQSDRQDHDEPDCVCRRTRAREGAAAHVRRDAAEGARRPRDGRRVLRLSQHGDCRR